MGLVLGAFLGVVFTVVFQAPLERLYAQIRSRVRRLSRPTRVLGTDFEEIGFKQLLVWSAARPLVPALHSVTLDQRTAEFSQSWFPEHVWAEERERARSTISGEVSCITSYTVDHGEAGVESNRFDVVVRPSYYADGVAVQRLLSDTDRPWWGDVVRLFDRAGPAEALKKCPSQSFFVVLTVTTTDRQCLAVRRASGGVATAGGLWSLGACETMGPIPSQPGTQPESFFQLAERAAFEELGLERRQYGHIWFTWFGLARWDGLFTIAHIGCHLSAKELEAKIVGSMGCYEVDGIRWIEVHSPELKQLAVPALLDGWVPFASLWSCQGLVDT